MFINFTVDDGLPSSLIYSINQDRKGYIWIATDMGLSRFDGYVFRNFTVKDGLPHNDIFGTYEDSKGRLWIKTFGPDFYYFFDDKIHRVRNKFEKQEGFLTKKIKEDSDGILWINPDLEGKPMFFYKYNNENLLDTIGLPETIKLPLVEPKVKTDFLLVNPGIYIFKNERIYKYRVVKFDKKFVLENIRNAKLRFDFHTLDTSMYLYENLLITCTKEGIYKEKSSTVNKKGNYFKSEKLMQFATSNKDMLHNSDRSQNLFSDFKFPLKSDLQNTFVDNQKNVWIATKSNGLYMLTTKGNAASTYIKDFGKYNVKIFHEIGNEIWAVDKDDNFYKLANGAIQPFPDPLKSKLAHLEDISHLYSGSSINELYILDYFGLIQRLNLSELDFEETCVTKIAYRNDGSKIVNTYQSNTGFSIKSISNYPSDTIFSATRLGMVKGWHDGQCLILEQQTKERCYAIEVIHENIWIGQPNGLFLFRNGELINLDSWKEENDILSKSIKDITSDSKGKLWIGTDGYGLYTVQDGVIRIIPELNHKIIKNIYVDANDNAWVSTNHGLYEIFDGVKAKQYNTAHGLASNEVNLAIVKENFVYVSTNSGLTVLDLEKTKVDHEIAAPFYVTALKIRGRDQVLSNLKSQYFDLSYDQNDLSLSFTCLSYESNKNIIYEYKMEGIDSVWQTTNIPKLSYPVLPPGHTYTLALKAKDINNNYALDQFELIFNIRQPWWEHWYLKVLLLLALAALLLYSFYRFRKKEIEKTATNKKFAELRLQALQAQLNPHFIFNALQAIQDFVANRDERAANKYMANFSKLMRLFLNATKEKYIYLEEELELLKLYIELEQLRFEPTFDYQIIYPESSNLNMFEIPSMLLQPFVENAINHGLKYKKGKGFLSIKIEQNKDQLFIEITDDGVGREKAMEIKQKALNSYKSRGMEIIEDRVRTIELVDNLVIKIIVEDVMVEGQVAGTKVKISMPINAQ